MRFSRLTAEVFAFFFLIFAALPLAAPAQDSIFELPAGTRIKVQMDAEVSSDVASVGDTFTTTVVEPVAVRGTIVVPVGTVIEGRVVKVEPAAGAGKGGALGVKFETIRFERGSSRTIDSVMNRREKNAGASILAILGGTAAGAILGGVARSGVGALIGAGIGAGAGTGIALARKGREARIRTNEKFEVELAAKVTLPPTDF